MKLLTVIVLLSFPFSLFAQKKPLDHSVYDSWQSIGERMISNDGKWVVYTVTPQEGDADLFIRSTYGTAFQKQIPRGYNALITEDNRFVVFKIKPTYKQTRDARIKKKKPEDMPKDSIGIVELGKDSVIKTAKIKSYKTPMKGSGWIAYQKEGGVRQPGAATQRTVDSLKRTIDSLTLLVTQIKNQKSGSRDQLDADEDPASASGANEGSDLVLRNLNTGKERTFKNVVDYFFNDYGQKLVMRVSKSAKDSSGANAVVLFDLQKSSLDTILKGGNDFRNFSFTEDGNKLSFVAERDTNTKALQKFYGLYLYRTGDDSASLLIDKKSEGMDLGMTVSENGIVSFSKSGRRLFFGTAPIQPPKDTTLVDFETAKLDIWHYKDDYLQTIQLFQLNNELKRNYLAVYDFGQNKMEQLGSKGLPTIIQTNEGDGDVFIGVTDTGRRVESQWSGSTKKDVYAINVRTGERKLVKKNHDGLIYPSSTGKYILLYDNKARNYFAWDGKELKSITSKIKVPLYNEENDTPDDPNPYGIMGWHEKDSFVYVYDRYDVWKVDPSNGSVSTLIWKMSLGRPSKNSYRYLRVDPDERFISSRQLLHFRIFNEISKITGIVTFNTNGIPDHFVTDIGPFSNNTFLKAKNTDSYLFSKEDYAHSPDLYFASVTTTDTIAGWHAGALPSVKISSINPQQSQYNWGTAELYKWKTFTGKAATGILYKPENFDSTKKYPLLITYYDKMSHRLFEFPNPEFTNGDINIPWFVTHGYLV
ncbi:MAG: S9 family peptidase, partial [Flavisolibacter sp.]